MLTKLSGNQGIDAVGAQLIYHALSAAGKNCDPFRPLTAEFDRLEGFWEERFKSFDEFRSSVGWASCDRRNIRSLVGQETADKIEF